jgi:hypothetical protein
MHISLFKLNQNSKPIVYCFLCEYIVSLAD